MKKTLLTCVAIAAVFAFASPAFGITCTVDQRPGATLLIPYFQVSFDGDGNVVTTGPDARDTIVTIANASAAPMIAHVNVFSRESNLVLDFNIALTGFDVQAMRISDIITGFLPVTTNSDGDDVCQRNPGASVYDGFDPDGFLRVRPLSPATGLDNTQATTQYSVPAYSFDVATELRTNCDDELEDLAIGYIVIDHANYCNLSNPSDANYYYNDAIGMENNLWGEIIFTSGTGVPTYAMSTVNLEADSSIGNAAEFGIFVARSFYALYWDPVLEFPPNACPNCGSGNPETDLLISSPWNVGFGDQREPLGLKWAVRWFDAGAALTTNFRVWRSSPAGGDCIFEEPTVTLTFFDEDENTTTQGTCPSPCTNPTFNFPLETQQRNITDFSRPPGALAGWVDVNFVNNASGTILDQAWIDYSFEGELALETILVPGTQLDPSSCNPLGFVLPTEFIGPVVPTVPTGTGV